MSESKSGTQYMSTLYLLYLAPDEIFYVKAIG